MNVLIEKVLWFCSKYFCFLLACLECFGQPAPGFIEKSGEAGCRGDNCVGWPMSGSIQPFKTLKTVSVVANT